MQLAVDAVLRDHCVDVLERHGDGLLLAWFDDFLDLHGVDGKAMLGGQRILHLQRQRPLEINGAAAFPYFRAVLLHRSKRDFLLEKDGTKIWEGDRKST